MLNNSDLLSLMERRLTALEREIQEIKNLKANLLTADKTPACVKLNCDDPGFMAMHAYPKEIVGNGGSACWLGSGDDVQLFLPVSPIKPYLCKLSLMPYKHVDFRNFKIMVNDKIVDHWIVGPKEDNRQQVCFYGPDAALPSISVVFLGLKSVRPLDIGESEDVRLLAFQFFGAEVEFPVAPRTEEVGA